MVTLHILVHRSVNYTAHAVGTGDKYCPQVASLKTLSDLDNSSKLG